MILTSFSLGNLASLSMRIMNSVVVVGLYYGFLTTFSIGPSYCLLFQAHIKVIEEGEKAIDKEVAATTGFIMGQLVMFISIYYTPLHLALGRPHTITFLVLSYLVLLFHWYNSEDFDGKRKHESTRKNSMRNPSIQCIYLINLIYQLLNHFFFPSSMLARLVTIYMFRYNNKMLFVTSSFVGWLIGHILFMKWVKFVLVWIDKNYFVRANMYILSNKYLFYVFRFYQDFIFYFRKSMNRFSSILFFFICLCTFGRTPSPFLTYKIMQQGIPEKKHVEREKTSEEEEEEEEGFTAKDPSPSLFQLFKEAYYKNIPTSFSGNQDISKLEILKEDSKIHLWVEKPLLISILFDYNRWNRPMRYIKNKRFENAVRNEMSQFYFSTCKNDGKERISFSYPPSLGIFREMIQRKISVSATQNYDKLYNDWIYTNEQKKKSLSNEFSNRIAVLDKKGLKINVLEKKIRLCNDKKNKDGQSNLILEAKKEYLPNRYDPFINGSYRGLIKELFFLNKIGRLEDAICINRIQILLTKDYNYTESLRKIGAESRVAPFVYFICFIRDSLTQTIPKKPQETIGIKEIRKKVPRWPYKLIDELELLHKEAEEGVEPVDDIREIPARRIILFKTEATETEPSRLIVLKRYTPGPQLRDLIKGSMRSQKRKTSTWSMWQSYSHSRFYLNRTDSTFNRLVRFWYYIKGIFLKYMRKISEFELLAYYPSFEYLFLSIEETGEHEDETKKDAVKEGGINEIDVQIRESELKWQFFICGQIIRTFILVTQSNIRKEIILPLLIIAKNIGRILLLQRPEFNEDFKELEKEVHFICTYNGVPSSDKKFPEGWKEEGIQIKVVYPFRLKPWHTSHQDKNNSFYLTTWGMPTQTPYGPPQPLKLYSFFKPIKKKLYKEFKKFRKNPRIIVIKKLLNRFIKKIFKKRLSKNFSNVNPNLEFELRDKSSEIIKENDSIINNQMIHESSIEAQFKNLTIYSLTQKRMKNLANKRSTIRKKMDQISKIVNISPNKTHYGVKRLESLQNIVQILKRRTARLIHKSGFFMEKIYVDLFLYILNISRIYTKKFFLESTKKNLDKSIYNNETNKNPIQFILTIKKSHFLFSSLLNRKIKNKLRSHSDLSFVSQAYVFYKLSQAQLINLYKLRSVFQYYGTSLFLKNEIKDYFGAQGIIHSELRTNKLPNSGMNQWKNWLKSNYQYGLSQREWSHLEPQKWRKKISKYCRGEKKNKKKWNSYEKEQLINSNYQNAKAPLLLLPNEKENLIKNHKYEVLSYKFLFHEDKKDSYSYRIPFQGNKNKEFSYTNNYNIHKGNLIDMWRSIPITYYFNNMDIEKNPDRKYFDWKIIHFDHLRKKGRIGAWIHNKYTKIEPKNYQIVYEFDMDDEIIIIDEKEKEIDEKEKKECFDDKNDIFCHKIYQKVNRSHQKVNRSHQKKNLFDWMGMNEEILSRPVSIESWFFPEFFFLYNVYKIQPWTIPINLLFSYIENASVNEENASVNEENASVNEEKKENASVNEEKKENASVNEEKKENASVNEEKKENDQRTFISFIRKNFEKKENISIHEDFICAEQKFLSFQTDWNKFVDDQDVLSNIDLGVLMRHLPEHKKRKRFALTFMKRGDLHLDLVLRNVVTPMNTLLNGGIFFIEPIRLSKSDGQFILYQTIGISWVHKSKKRQNNQKRSRDKNNYDLLIPENILSPRRRRELRILICFNSRNNKGVDKNPVYCNGNRVNKGSQFFDKSKDLDRDKKKLIKFVLWPNYRLEDLACMNRYWFDTNNGSRFSILRIRMYPRLKR